VLVVEDAHTPALEIGLKKGGHKVGEASGGRGKAGG
jgi:hypothetical protein